MLDHQEARLWADHHEAFGRWVADAVHATLDAFKVLQRQRYASPWRREEDGAEAMPRSAA